MKGASPSEQGAGREHVLTYEFLLFLFLLQPSRRVVEFSTSDKLGVCGGDWVESLAAPCCLW